MSIKAVSVNQKEDTETAFRLLWSNRKYIILEVDGPFSAYGNDKST